MASRLSYVFLELGKVFRVGNVLRMEKFRVVKPIFPRLLHSYSVSDGTETDTLYKNIDIEFKGHDLAVMRSYKNFVTQAAKELDIQISQTWTPPRIKNLWTLLKSAHIYKKHKVQYETRTNFKVIQLKHLTGSTADTFLEYIQRNLPEGMAMKVSRHSLEALPKHLK